MIEGVARWVDSRTRLAKFVRTALNHVFPDHWSFMLGEIALYSFVILVITGTYMAMFFHGSSAKVIYHGTYRPLDGVQVSAAFQSVMHLSFDVPAGLLIRQMHHWAADIFIGAILAHLARIFFTAAYRRPRELNWLVGLTLLVLALANGYLGYSICGDLLSGAGLRIGYAIMLSIPVIGPWITFLAMGGTVPTDTTVPRLYALHIFLVPALIALLIGVHLAIIWRQLHTNYPGPKRTEKTIVGARVWPSYTLKSLGLFLLVVAAVAALGGLVQIDPVWIYGPYNPVAILPGAQPDWYLGWVEGAMRLFPGVNLWLGHYLVPEVFFPGFLFPCLVFLGLYAWPFLEKFLSFDFRTHNVLRLPRQQPWITAFGCAVAVFMLVLLVAGGDDVVAVADDANVVQIRRILRVLVFVAPLVTGAVVYWLCRRRDRRHPVPAEEMSAEAILEQEETTAQLQ
jgi:ubiquinol-cytochrome c reductase cytochrome b subunit